MSEYRLQIVFADGTVARFLPGRASEEGALIQAVADRIVSKGVGMFTSEAKVRAAIVAGMSEVFEAVKRNVQP